MTQYNNLNVQLLNSQLNKFKSPIKNETKVNLRLSSKMMGDNDTNFPHKLLLTNRQVSKILGSGNRPLSSASHMTTLLMSNDEIGDIIKIVKSLEILVYY